MAEPLTHSEEFSAAGARCLVTALAAAMEYAREQRCLDALTPSSLTVALMAEHMIGAGWPAGLDGPLAGHPVEQDTRPLGDDDEPGRAS